MHLDWPTSSLLLGIIFSTTALIIKYFPPNTKSTNTFYSTNEQYEKRVRKIEERQAVLYERWDSYIRTIKQLHTDFRNLQQEVSTLNATVLKFLEAQR